MPHLSQLLKINLHYTQIIFFSQKIVVVIIFKENTNKGNINYYYQTELNLCSIIRVDWAFNFNNIKFWVLNVNVNALMNNLNAVVVYYSMQFQFR